MKHLETVFRTILVLLCACWTTQTASAQEDFNAEYYDSVEVSLLTCQPHDEVYSLYGHTAIRYHDMHKDNSTDAAFNYGVFDFKKPYFVLRFVFGLTDYELGAYPYHFFLKEYQHFGSMVTEQVLNLSSYEKGVLHQLLSENLRPENKIYRYNYFYNNCTTKARDVIEKCISGKVEYTGREDFTPSYREMVHEMTRNNPWARFGNDLLLGIKADQQTDRRQQEFLPYNLMYDFDHAQIYENGQYRPMVKERRVAVPGGVQIIQEGFPLSPTVCGILLLLIGILIFLAEWRWKRSLLAWDILLMLTTGFIGITLFLMLFSQHPTVSLNLQFLLLNPLPWFFLWPVIKRRQTRYWTITLVLAVLFLIGALFQTYAEGIWSLALCLLLQCCIHIKRVSA
ncbi:MAG: DUF4105 domain-containing protein [Prevotella sp.]|nr:DUF4105 domain-containing protein [Prevotella sp.]